MRLEILAPLLFVLPACSGSGLPAGYDGYASGGGRALYEPGVPFFEMEPAVRFHGDASAVEVRYSVHFAALVFLKSGEDYEGGYEMHVRLFDQGTESLAAGATESQSLRVSRYDSTIGFHPHAGRLETQVLPGDYVLEATLTDLKSGESSRQRRDIHVPRVAEGETFVSPIFLEDRSGGDGSRAMGSGCRSDEDGPRTMGNGSRSDEDGPQAIEGESQTMEDGSRTVEDGSQMMEGTFCTVHSLHVPARSHALSAYVEMYNVPEPGEITVTMVLSRFESDTTVASPPYWIQPSRGSLAWVGVDWSQVDTVLAQRSTMWTEVDAVSPQVDTVRQAQRASDRVSGDSVRSDPERLLQTMGRGSVAEFMLPPLRKGLYQLDVSGMDSSGTLLFERTRMVSSGSPFYPRVTLLGDLVESLDYIAYDDEVDAIREAPTTTEARRRFDAFWGTLVSDRQAASNLLTLYYGRIEEANALFGGYKEGWRTDRGMIFTVLGPPIYVERRHDVEVWHYGYGHQDPVNTYLFDRVSHQADAPFETYVLRRHPYYRRGWAQAIQRWRKGRVF